MDLTLSGHSSQGGNSTREAPRHSADASNIYRDPWQRNSRDENSEKWQPNGRFKSNTVTIKKISLFDSNQLEELCNEDGDDLILRLVNEKSDFSGCLNTKLTPDQIVLLLRLLVKTFSSAFDLNKTILMTMICQSGFNEHLKTFLLLDNKPTAYFWRDKEKFWKNLIAYCEAIINTVPLSAGDALQPLLSTAVSFKAKKELQQKLLHQVEVERGRFGDKLSCLLTPSEIVTCEESPAKRNIVEGPYESINHYMRVQIRLFRDDIMSPVRNAVSNYLKSGFIDYQVYNVEIYPEVQFRRLIWDFERSAVVVQITMSQAQERIYCHKRFRFRSLVCFTDDNFTTLVYGEILEHTEEGQLVDLITDMSNIRFHVNYVMVEYRYDTKPTCCVLLASQTIAEETFPMKEYFVNVDSKRRKELPGYYTRSKLLQLNGRLVDVDAGNWPTAEQLDLDNTQYRAFTNALTQKFVIIQGLPGTGKTHLGLLIAKTLILNERLWQHNSHDEQTRKTSILVICARNHILDQFLERLIRVTKSVVRVGGNSKNEKLKEFHIQNKREPADEVSRQKRCRIWKIQKEMKIICSTLNRILNYEHIFDFSCFVQLIPQLKGTWFENAGSDGIRTWLLGQGRSQGETQFIDAKSSLQCQEDGNCNVNTSEMQVDLEGNLEKQTESSVRIAIENMTIENMRHNLNHMYNIAELIRTNDGEEEEIYALKMRLEQDKYVPVHHRPRNVNLNAPESIHPNDRWRLYFYWLDMYKRILRQKLSKLRLHEKELYNAYDELRKIQDLKLLREHVVVGMTATVAAGLQSTLKSLRCPIVIVEEAAELFELKLIASLTTDCRHLILIGDEHREKVGLFERLVKNKINCNTLGVQHRMRPEIAELIVPAIYPKLENHMSVYNFPPVQGIDSSLYFITHQKEEDRLRNPFEAEYLIHLAKYLIFNGYKPNDITIFTTHSMQRLAILKERDNFDMLEDVRVSYLGSFDGEESKIILLSLVRNNDQQSIGFLRFDDQVSVLLSRAREGLYMMGNIDLLSSNSDVWPKIRSTLESRNNIGTALPLRCQIHSDVVTKVETVQDFSLVSNGGCSKTCNEILSCTHKCVNQCHTYDRGHREYKCKEKCVRIRCELNHICPKICDDACGDCGVPVPKRLTCNHMQDVPCHMDPNDFECPVPIEAELLCEHQVEKPCHVDVTMFTCPHCSDRR